MDAFNATRFYPVPLRDLSGVIQDTQTYFLENGYEVCVEDSSFGSFISLSKGGIFKTVLGLKTALNVELRMLPDEIQTDAKVGIWGQQFFPTLIMLFVTWPVLLTQIAGLIKQAQLDDEVLQVVGEAIDRHQAAQSSMQTEFCVNCGASIDADSAFCPVCGGKKE